MAQVKKNNRKILYFTDQVSTSFHSFLEYPCTVVEAPMGYGKTTAVTEAMETINAKVIWQKLYDRSTAEFWAGFCEAISKINQKCAKGLQHINMLEDSLMSRELVRLLDLLNISGPTVLIIDDYHLIKSQAIDNFLRLLILHMPKNLHLVIITRTAFLDNGCELQLKGLLYYIGAKTLEFSQLDIKNYFQAIGIHLEQEELQQLCVYSEGWISALYLIALDYKNHGYFVFTRNVPELVYETIYTSLQEETKSFLMSLCLLDTFTLEQAQAIWQKENAKVLLDSLVINNAFVSQDRVTGRYSLHNIFSLCIKEQFELLQQDRQSAIWRQAGEVYYKAREYLRAMECFYHANHFDGVLRAMEGEDLVISIQNEHKDLLIKCYKDCPAEIKKQHPRAILFFAVHFVTQFLDLELFSKACQDFQNSIEEQNTLSKEERNQLLGEYELLQMFAYYNDLVKMNECSKKAASLLNRPAKFFDTNDSFMFGAPSMLYLYYREAGKLVDLIDFIRSGSLYYTQFNSGHGQGSRPLLEAEWLYQIGNFEEAEITVHKSIAMANKAEQRDVELAGLFLLAKLALYQGEYVRITELLKQMEHLVRQEVEHAHAYWLVYTLDLCKAEIFACLEQINQVPEWIFEYEYPKHMQFLSIAYANMVYGKALLLKGSNTQLIGLTEQFKEIAFVSPNMLAILTTDIYAAIASYRISRIEDCQIALRRALDMAMSDDILMPFVENAKSLLPILDVLIGESRYLTFIKKIKNAYEQYDKSIEQIKRKYFDTATPKLTEREKQIARLVIQGLNNKEIAAMLFISPNTVKSELKNIFRKLNINSRVLLKKEMIS